MFTMGTILPWQDSGCSSHFPWQYHELASPAVTTWVQESLLPCVILTPHHIATRDSLTVWPLCFFSILPQCYVPFWVKKKKRIILVVFWNLNVLRLKAHSRAIPARQTPVLKTQLISMQPICNINIATALHHDSMPCVNGLQFKQSWMIT